MSRVLRTASLLALLIAAPFAANAQALDEPSPFWLSAGLGAGAFQAMSPAPAAGRHGVAASLEMGYRLRPEMGVGLELGTVSPASGCANQGCGRTAADFAPAFDRLHAFGSFHPRNSRWSLRAGLGVSRFCHQRHWSPNAWSWRDTVNLILDDEDLVDSPLGTGAWNCDARQYALGGSLSLGYDWRLSSSAPVTMGVRLTAEAARYERNREFDMPAFRHRALLLTLHLGVN